MMEAIGLLVAIIFAGFLIVAGIALLVTAQSFGSVHISDKLMPFVLILLGCWLAYWVFNNSPWVLIARRIM